MDCRTPPRENAELNHNLMIAELNHNLMIAKICRTPPRENAELDHNLVIGNIRLLGRIAPNHPKGVLSKTGELSIYQD